jgi:transcriptional regulator with XRE-family HTH domain
MTSFPAKLAALRESAKLSQEDLADASGLTRQAIFNYEAGKRSPGWKEVQAIATALGVATDALRDD